MAKPEPSPRLSRRLFLASAPLAATISGLSPSVGLAAELEAAIDRERDVLAAKPFCDAEYSKAADASAKIVRRICADPARDIEGLKLKARAYLWCYADDAQDALSCLAERGDTVDRKLLNALMRDLFAL